MGPSHWIISNAELVPLRDRCRNIIVSLPLCKSSDAVLDSRLVCNYSHNWSSQVRYFVQLFFLRLSCTSTPRKERKEEGLEATTTSSTFIRGATNDKGIVGYLQCICKFIALRLFSNLWSRHAWSMFHAFGKYNILLNGFNNCSVEKHFKLQVK